MIFIKRIKENAILSIIGSSGYYALETLWRGFSHWTMAVAGGICFPLLYRMNKNLHHESFFKRCAFGSVIITVIEFITGCIVNRKLKWKVWDYSKQKFNILGQICPLFTFLWFLLCIPVLLFANHLRKKLI